MKQCSRRLSKLPAGEALTQFIAITRRRAKFCCHRLSILVNLCVENKNAVLKVVLALISTLSVLQIVSTHYRYQYVPSIPIGCDDECRRFHNLLISVEQNSSWPNHKPKGVVVLLLGAWDFPPSDAFISFIRNFDNTFNRQFNYPLIAFHDVPDLNVTVRQQILSSTLTDIFFQYVNFTLPWFINPFLVTRNCYGLSGFGFGYRHMCRFHAKTIYEQPIMRSEMLDYIWRLDDDSRITGPVDVDPFVTMRDRKLKYGYVHKNADSTRCVKGLWPAAERYWARAGFEELISMEYPLKFDNNFEISATSLWRSKEYTDYINYIDRLGGIYYSRWGDAPVKSLAVSRLVNTTELHQFSDIEYIHGGLFKKHVSGDVH